MAEVAHAGTRGEYHPISPASSRSRWASTSVRSKPNTTKPGTPCDVAFRASCSSSGETLLHRFAPVQAGFAPGNDGDRRRRSLRAKRSNLPSQGSRSLCRCAPRHDIAGLSPSLRVQRGNLFTPLPVCDTSLDSRARREAPTDLFVGVRYGGLDQPKAHGQTSLPVPPSIRASRLNTYLSVDVRSAALVRQPVGKSEYG